MFKKASSINEEAFFCFPVCKSNVFTTTGTSNSSSRNQATFPPSYRFYDHAIAIHPIIKSITIFLYFLNLQFHCGLIVIMNCFNGILNFTSQVTITCGTFPVDNLMLMRSLHIHLFRYQIKAHNTRFTFFYKVICNNCFTRNSIQRINHSTIRYIYICSILITEH